ncbi:hypothetical protein AGMMS50239_04650 [Bacteroidia bacterium]|nr:hypothetical protein AGMMS50239_04650 [Bacteroidia bacterium]
MKTLFLILIIIMQSGFIISAQKVAGNYDRDNRLRIKMLNNIVLSDSIRNFLEEMDRPFQEAIESLYPAFMVESLTGDTITEHDLLGKVTLINFWFSACTPCIAEISVLDALYKKIKDNTNFQFVSFCTDPFDEVRKFAGKYQMTYPVYPISRDKFSDLLIRGFPINFVVNQEGRIVYCNRGGLVENGKATEEMQKMEQFIMTSLSGKNYAWDTQE